MDNNNNYQPQYQPQPAPGPTPAPGPDQAQPTYQQPVQPTYQQPAQPQYQPQPAPSQPTYQQPAYQQTIQPVYQQPVQPQYQQTYPPQYIKDPLMASADEMDLELKKQRRKKANILCFISLGLYLAPKILSLLYSLISGMAGNISSLNGNEAVTAVGVIALIFLFLMAACNIGAWVTMIIARVKYKDSVFAKVLMWVYIGLLIAAVVATILVIAMCWAIIDSLQGASC